jgi:oligosaccharide repeat unit polymerase
VTGFAEISTVLGEIALGVVAIMILAHIQKHLRRVVTGRNVVLGSIMVWYLLEAVTITNATDGEVVGLTQNKYDYGLLCVMLSAISFLIAYESRNLKMFDGFGHRLTVIDNLNWQWRIFATGFIIGSLPILIIGKFDLTLFLDGVFEFQKRWSSRLSRGRYGGFRDAFLELRLFFNAVLPIAIIIVLRKDSSFGQKAASGKFIMWMLLKALNSGSRASFFGIALPVAGGVYFLLRDDLKKMAVLIGVPFMVIAGYYWSAAVVVTRNSGEFRFEAATEAKYVGFEMFRELLYISEQIGGTLDYELGRTYATQVVNPIPRFVWKNKPVSDAGLMLAIARGEVNKETGEAYLTRSPGLIGEMYWNFGLIGVVFLSAMGGFIVKSWDHMRLAHRHSFVVFMVHAEGLVILFLSGRSFSMSALYGLIAIYLLMVFFGLGAPKKQTVILSNQTTPPQNPPPQPRVTKRSA